MTVHPSRRRRRSDAAGQAKSALLATDDAALRALGERLVEALAVIGDVAGELGDYLSELPSDASTLEAKLARQAELRNLTRKYAADVDGVLAWAAGCPRAAGATRRLRRGAGRCCNNGSTNCTARWSRPPPH